VVIVKFRLKMEAILKSNLTLENNKESASLDKPYYDNNNTNIVKL